MRTAVITGASAGIGLNIAKAFLSEGYNVTTIARRDLEPLSESHAHVTADLASWNECERACAEIAARYTSLDALINNVGKSEWRSLSAIDERFFDDLIRLNVQSYVAVTKYLTPILAKNSAIVNISSLAGKRGSANNSIYCASKFAVNGLTQAWAKELGPIGVRVNAVCPVLVRSEGLDAALDRVDAPAHQLGNVSFLAKFADEQTALGRLPTASEVSDLCLYLASNRASSITGQCINVDCGVLPQ